MASSRTSRAALPIAVALAGIVLAAAQHRRGASVITGAAASTGRVATLDAPAECGLEQTDLDSTRISNPRGRRNRWTDAEIFDALRGAATYEYPLSTTGYDALIAIGEIHGPTASRIGQRFGTWSAACGAAGIEARPTSGTRSQSRWTDDDLAGALRRFLDSTDGPRTTTAFDLWRRAEQVEAPSSSLIGIRFGSWAEAKRRAVDLFRVDDEVSV